MDWDAAIRSELDGMVPYAPGLRASEVRERSGKERVLKLSSNEHPCTPFPSAIAAMEAVLPRLNRYPDGSARALRSALCDHLDVANEHLVIGNGSNELIRLIAQVTLRPGDEVVFAWPSFVVYPMVTQMFGATAVKIPLDENERHDLPAILAAITENTRIVFLCNPNNPTGTIYGREPFEAFLEKVPEHVLVVVDEAYFEFVMATDYPNGLAYFDGDRPLVVLRTFSKMYSLAGLRIGYGVLPDRLAVATHQVREPFNVNSVAQVGAYYSLEDTAEVDRRRHENDEQKGVMYEALDRLGISYVPSETNFVYLMTGKPEEVFAGLLAEGIIARDFGGAPALRLGVGTPEDTEVVCAALESVVDRLGGI